MKKFFIGLLIILLYSAGLVYYTIHVFDARFSPYCLELNNDKFFVSLVDDVHYIDKNDYIVYVSGKTCKLILFYHKSELVGAINYN